LKSKKLTGRPSALAIFSIVALAGLCFAFSMRLM
jgi:hypothetical protein